MKRRIFIPVIIVLILFIASISTFTYINFEKEELHAKTLKYLTETKGYTEKEIKSIEVEHSFLALFLTYDEWSISVIFIDEPKTIYSYSYKNKGISQYGSSGHGINHREGLTAEERKMEEERIIQQDKENSELAKYSPRITD